MNKAIFKRIGIIKLLFILFSFSPGFYTAQAIQTKSIIYSVEHGLSQSTVNSILQDDYGQIWLGTRNGLNLFNGYDFEVFLHSPSDDNSIINNEITRLYKLDSSNILVGTRDGICRLNILTKESYSYDYKSLGYTEFVVNDIFKDNNNRLWVAAREGIFIYDETTDNFIAYDNVNAPTGSVYEIAQNEDNELWFGAGNGLFTLRNNEWQVVTDYLYNPNGTKEDRIVAIYFDRYNNLWVGTRSNGVYNISRKGDVRIKHFNTSTNNKTQLTSNEIRDIIEDKKGRMWIGTKEGINIFDPFSNEVEAIQSKISIINSISQNSVYNIFEDKQGNIWVGTWSGGVNLLDIDYNGFIPITHFKDGENSGPFRAVSSVTEFNGELWVGSENNGIVVMDQNGNTIKTLNTSNKLRSNHIKKLYTDKNNNIWIGYYDRGIQVYSPKTGTITNKVDFINVYDIKEYPTNVFWITSGRQFIKLDLNTNKQQSFIYQGNQESTNLQAGATILISSNKKLWTGSRFGVDVYNTSDEKLIRHYNLTDLPDGNYSMHIFSLAEDIDQNLWIGTNQGLYSINTQSKDTSIKASEHNFKEYIIYGILPHGETLWLSTHIGIIKYNTKSGEVDKYTQTEGLQSNEFIRNSAFKTKSNLFIFGGINGLTAFNPNFKVTKEEELNVLISYINFTNKVGDPENLHYPVNNPEKPLKLPPRQSSISFEFSGTNYLHSNELKFAFKLDGLNETWRSNGSLRSVRFTNLSPGTYTFNVSILDDNNRLIGQAAALKFKIQRPFYATIIAFIIYLIIIAGILIIIYSSQAQKRKIEHELKFEKLEHDKEAQLNELKTKFFMNVSHEFRTPLTVIHGPIERMITNNDYKIEAQEAQTMLRNTERLIGLLDQLLELRKVEKGKTKIKLELLDLNLFTKDVIQLFRTIAFEKNITLEFTASSRVKLWADRDKMEKVLSNLLSNAIKFTPDNGRIIVEVSENQDPLKEIVNAEISVIDNGIGMSQEEIVHIFNRFESLDESKSNPKGIGIGLSLANELVKYHHGTIKVDSNVGQGTAFTVILPKQREIYKNDKDVVFIEDTVPELIKDEQPTDTSTKVDERKTILVVDDNRDIRQYVSGILKNYNVIEAESVEEAETYLEGNMPNLIVSDVILPGKDGYEFCKQIKSEQNTSHIPVILMTAKGNDDNRIQGLEQGADAFIPKPFSERIMKVWVEKLFAAQQKMLDYYMSQILYSSKGSGEKKTSLKDSFLEKARKIIEKDIANPDLSVEMLSKQMNMSRSNLHIKFKAIINQTPSDFIRIIRLNHAAQLLLNGENNIVEAAYGSGFNSPSYFTKCFKQYFKKTPTEFVEQSSNG